MPGGQFFVVGKEGGGMFFVAKKSGYVPPEGESVDFNFQSYTPPANDDVDFDFE